MSYLPLSSAPYTSFKNLQQSAWSSGLLLPPLEDYLQEEHVNHEPSYIAYPHEAVSYEETYTAYYHPTAYEAEYPPHFAEYRGYEIPRRFRNARSVAPRTSQQPVDGKEIDVAGASATSVPSTSFAEVALKQAAPPMALPPPPPMHAALLTAPNHQFEKLMLRWYGKVVEAVAAQSARGRESVSSFILPLTPCPAPNKDLSFRAWAKAACKWWDTEYYRQLNPNSGRAPYEGYH